MKVQKNQIPTTAPAAGTPAAKTSEVAAPKQATEAEAVEIGAEAKTLLENGQGGTPIGMQAQPAGGTLARHGVATITKMSNLPENPLQNNEGLGALLDRMLPHDLKERAGSGYGREDLIRYADHIGEQISEEMDKRHPNHGLLFTSIVANALESAIEKAGNKKDLRKATMSWMKFIVEDASLIAGESVNKAKFHDDPSGEKMLGSKAQEAVVVGISNAFRLDTTADSSIARQVLKTLKR